MRFCRLRFNLYLLPLLVCLALSGCTMFQHKHEPVSVLRVHVESEAASVGSTKTISLLRSHPVSINISTDPILTEADVQSARLLDSPGGFAIELKFEETAGWRLEQYSAINPGKHLAIFSQWSETEKDGRWLAAPQISRRIGNATLVFTPDASHEEAEKIVAGLTIAAKKNAGLKDQQ